MYQLSKLFLATLLVVNSVSANAQTTTAATLTPTIAPAPADATELAARIDASIAPYFKADMPGATMIVTHDGKTVFRKAYGMADMDAKLPLSADMALRLGSVTKQFTATAILILAEQGKLSLSDDIRKFLPDFPYKGKTITVEHLLTHTSGVPNYTSNPSFATTMAQDMTVAQMMATFQDAPLAFAPGERYAYSNSGYFLLGAIIEKVSGMRYADFLARSIFQPLGMQHTAYEGAERKPVVQARGYRGSQGKFSLGLPLSMTQPFAAGSLVSTVDDLARWDAAITAGKLLKPTSWRQAFTPYTLKSGAPTRYGYGWQVGKLKGSSTLEHGGGINGFSSYALRLPDEKVYVALLANSESGVVIPPLLAYKAAAMAIGKPFPDFKAITLDAKALDAFVGTYKVNEKVNSFVSREGDQLFIQRTNSGRQALTPYASTGFFIADTLTEVQFGKNAQDEVTHLTFSDPSGEATNPRTSATTPPGRMAIQLASGIFERYVGKYQLAPGFVLEVKQDGEKYIAQATGQRPLEILPESEVMFFATAIDAQLRFELGADGAVTQVVLLQNGRAVPGKRL